VATGDVERAVERLEAALEHYRSENAPCLAVAHAQFLVRALIAAGDSARARRLALAAAQEADDYGLVATAEQLRALIPT
jgi:hypothetical protein